MKGFFLFFFLLFFLTSMKGWCTAFRIYSMKTIDVAQWCTNQNLIEQTTTIYSSFNIHIIDVVHVIGYCQLNWHYLGSVWISFIAENWKLKIENWKHCSKIIFKYLNSAVGPSFNLKFAEFCTCGSCAWDPQKKRQTLIFYHFNNIQTHT